MAVMKFSWGIRPSWTFIRKDVTVIKVLEYYNNIIRYMNKVVNIVLCFLATLLLTACFGSKMTSSAGGEVTGVSGRAFSEHFPEERKNSPRFTVQGGHNV